MIGQTLDKRYKIIRKLGSGGFGEAFLAKDISLHGIFCVVKQLKPIDKSEQFLKIARRLFVTESETLLRLGKHDQIPTLLAHLEKEKDFFLVQEFVDGHPLSAEIRVNQPLAVDDVVDLLASALEPLAFAHANNVIHRDIKPDNLMRRHSDGKVVLIDFGAVKEVVNSSSIAQGQAVFTVGIGTPGYMPIEQANGKPKFSSDIYALGITCIQALTGLSEQELDPNSWRHLINVDASLADILDRMVHYDFNHRYPSGSEALEAVREYVKENPEASPKVPYSPPPELVNNPSYTSVTVPTRKFSIATRVSTVFHLPETLVSKVFLWFLLSSSNALIGFICCIPFLASFLGISLSLGAIEKGLTYGWNLLFINILSLLIICGIWYVGAMITLKIRRSSISKFVYYGWGRNFEISMLSLCVMSYALFLEGEPNNIVNLVIEWGFLFISIVSSISICDTFGSSGFHDELVNIRENINRLWYQPLLILIQPIATILSLYLGLKFAMENGVYANPIDRLLTGFTSCLILTGSYGIFTSIFFAIVFDLKTFKAAKDNPFH
jgi:serine/threonine protein kinase